MQQMLQNFILEIKLSFLFLLPLPESLETRLMWHVRLLQVMCGYMSQNCTAGCTTVCVGRGKRGAWLLSGLYLGLIPWVLSSRYRTSKWILLSLPPTTPGVFWGANFSSSLNSSGPGGTIPLAMRS